MPFMNPTRGTRRHARKNVAEFVVPLCGAENGALVALNAPELSDHLAPYERDALRQEATTVTCGRCLRLLARTATAGPTATAWSLIGHHGRFQMPGGRAVYEAVMYNAGSARSERPRLARLVAEPTGLRQVNRWVDAEQLIVVLHDETSEDES